ncbi:MAG: cobalamin biosynthesis protein P47K [Planctomycetaceae bacterium]|nr:cobalamin biosynthesis protein P47K [Planctomycetaceae bacterium]MCP4461177.1 cobalamin biosynthesis protein P47K [Planctomycetaceae bacterium]MDG1807253.1 GTP-binding protein [Pirellulaceae bacterium]MDG2104064.1 GTP-binding protein [Pirellulaceae bacterium]
MSSIRFVMIGGFLGAGKTTTIGRLAAEYRNRGLNVGIVTNDQADDLVDTLTLREMGNAVGEVAGACFCCNFDELANTIAELGEKHQPDIVIAEPVGSCTDLVATVIQPLVHLYDQQYEIAPYGVILKPSHGRKILSGLKNGGFSPKAAYIFRKQLEEADFIILNHIDRLSEDEIAELVGLLKDSHPDIPVLKISAREGQGIDELIAMFEQTGDFGHRILELDYDVYAEGEAELGWLNCSFSASAENSFSLDDVLVSIVEALRIKFAEIGGETAHLKAIGLWEGFHGVANLVSSDSATELSLPSDCQTHKAEIVVNARVAIAPDVLDAQVRESIAQTAEKFGLECEMRKSQSFRPGRPVPTHRYDRDGNPRTASP